MNKIIEVELVFVLKSKQHSLCISLHSLTEAHSFTVQDVITASGCLEHYAELKDWTKRVGIFGEQVSADTIIKMGDRVEIYSDLQCDAKAARRHRVAMMNKAIAREKSKPKPKKIKRYDTL